MALKDAIAWFDDLAPHLQMDGRIYWQTLKTHCTESINIQLFKSEIAKLKKEFIFCEPAIDHKKNYNKAIDDVIEKLSKYE